MKARQDQLHFNLFSKDKRRSDKDRAGKEKMELNKPVPLMMFTADKNQSLKLPPSLFTIKKLHQHFSKSPNSSCPDAHSRDCIPSSGSRTLQISQSWTIPSDISFLTFFFPLITKQMMSVEFCPSYCQYIPYNITSDVLVFWLLFLSWTGFCMYVLKYLNLETSTNFCFV